MKKWSERRKQDKLKQSIYYSCHLFCEACNKLGEIVHEIIFRSQGGKCEGVNMITLCADCHDRAHFKKKPYIYKEELWSIKNLDIEKMQEQVRLLKCGQKQR